MIQQMYDKSKSTRSSSTRTTTTTTTTDHHLSRRQRQRILPLRVSALLRIEFLLIIFIMTMMRIMGMLSSLQPPPSSVIVTATSRSSLSSRRQRRHIGTIPAAFLTTTTVPGRIIEKSNDINKKKIGLIHRRNFYYPPTHPIETSLVLSSSLTTRLLWAKNSHSSTSSSSSFFSSSSNSSKFSSTSTSLPSPTTTTMSPIVHAIYESFQTHVLLPINERMSSLSSSSFETPNKILLVVSVSGGCDSMALLHGMIQFCNQQQEQQEQQEQSIPQYQLIVAHFNHNQRGIESDLDCQLVIDTCQYYNIPYHIYHWNDNKNKNHKNNHIKNDKNDKALVQQQPTKFSQDIARQWRRETLLQLVQDQLANEEEKAKVKDHQQYPNPPTSSSSSSSSHEHHHYHRHGIILTAHHKDDSYESLLLKLLRGVHITNLYQGIAPSTMLLVQETTTEKENDDDKSNNNNNKEQDEDEEDDNDRPTSSNNNNSTTTTTTTTTTTIQLLRPFLSLSKQDLVNYLQQELQNGNLPTTTTDVWREDGSNTSPKYLRNRVRNELVPLLEDLLQANNNNNHHNHNNDHGGGRFSLLERRLETLMEQSRQVQEDLEPRVQAYLQRAVTEDGKYFQLFPTTTTTTTTAATTTTTTTTTEADNNNNPSSVSVSPFSSSFPSSPSSSLVESQALYQWISRNPLMSSSPLSHATTTTPITPSVSHEQMQRIIRQLTEYPNNRQWTLEIGSHWNVIRMGNVLSVIRRQPQTKTSNKKNQDTNNNNNHDHDHHQQQQQQQNQSNEEDSSTSTSTTARSLPNTGTTGGEGDTSSTMVPVSYRVLSSQTNMLREKQGQNSTRLVLAIPKHHLPTIQVDDSDTLTSSTIAGTPDISNLSFTTSTVGAWSTYCTTTTAATTTPSNPSEVVRPALTFVPTWRKGRTPTKLKQFLRGQGVPLHRREDTPIVLLLLDSTTKMKMTTTNTDLIQKEKDEDNTDIPSRVDDGKSQYGDSHRLMESSSPSTTPIVVAVQVNEEWMIHADYDPFASSSPTSSVPPEKSGNSSDDDDDDDKRDSSTSGERFLIELLETPTVR